MRKKSYAERQRTTLIISLCTTALIAFVWGTLILPQTLTINETETSRANTATPLKTLSEDIGIIFGDIENRIDQLGTTMGEIFSDEGEFAVEAENETSTPMGSRGEDFYVEEESTSSAPSSIDGDLGESSETSGDAALVGETELSQDQTELDVEGQNPF